MAANPRRAAPRALLLLVVGLLCSTLIAPTAVLADTDLAVGATAHIANAGSDVGIRSAPRWDAEDLASVPEGTTVSILDGPLTADDGSIWFQISADAGEGYVAADYLASGAADEPTDSATTPDSSPPDAEATTTVGDDTGGGYGADPTAVTGDTLTPEAGGDGVYGDATGEAGTVIPGETVTADDGIYGIAPTPEVVEGTIVPDFGDEATAEATTSPVDDAEGTDSGEATEPAATVSTDGGEGDAAADPAATVPVTQGEIRGTDGDGARCRVADNVRAEIIAVLQEGQTVELAGESVRDWQPVTCQDRPGFVLAKYVTIRGKRIAHVTAETAATEVRPASDPAATPIAENHAQAGVDAPQPTRTTRDAAEEGRPSPVDPTRRANGQDQGQTQAGEDGADGKDGVSELNGADGADGADTTATTVTIGGGGGVPCRVSARDDGELVTVLARGTTVVLRGQPAAGWRPVVCAGANGFIRDDARTVPVLDEAESTATTPGQKRGETQATDDGPPAAAAPGEALMTSAQEAEAPASGVATITGTGGLGVRCRADANDGADVLTVVPEGTTVSLRGAAVGDWTPVVCDGTDGFIYSDYVSANGDSSGTPPDDGSTDAPPSSSLVSGDTAQVSGAGGGGVRFRAAPSYDAPVITVLSEGTVVDVIDGSTGEWVAVSFSGTSGFIHMDYLTPVDGGASDGTPEPGTGSGDGGLAIGSNAVTTADLNVRYQPSFSSNVAAVAPAGTVVQITGPSEDGFYPVDWDGLTGYMYGEYLSPTDAPPSAGDGTGDTDPGDSGTGPPDSGNTGSGDSGGGSIAGLSGIWGGANEPIIQEFGRTDWSVSHPDYYDYGTDYGLDGVSHPGIDIGMPYGTQLYSPVDGTVQIAGGTPYYTNYGDGSFGVGELLIQLDNGDQVIMGHMSLISVQVGQRVSTGDLVGLSGGYNSDHLHLETRVRQSDGSYIIVDPRDFFGV